MWQHCHLPLVGVFSLHLEPSCACAASTFYRTVAANMVVESNGCGELVLRSATTWPSGVLLVLVTCALSRTLEMMQNGALRKLGLEPIATFVSAGRVLHL